MNALLMIAVLLGGPADAAGPPPADQVDPGDVRDSSLKLRKGLTAIGLRPVSMQVKENGGRLYIAMELDSWRWRQTMRSPCRKKLALTLWAFGFRHGGEGGSSAPYSLSREVGSQDDLDDLDKLSEELSAGAEECRSELAAVRGSTQPAAGSAVDAPKQPPASGNMTFAQILAASRTSVFPKRLVPSISDDFDPMRSYYAAVSAIAYGGYAYGWRYPYRGGRRGRRGYRVAPYRAMPVERIPPGWLQP